MTKISYVTSETGYGIEAIGHAAYATKGMDIVCAAVSVLMQTLLVRTLDKTKDVKSKVDNGYMYISATGDVSECFDTIMVGLRLLESEYPTNVEICYGGCPIITEIKV